MGFLFIPNNVPVGHQHQLPPTQGTPVGSIWQCDECRRAYRREMWFGWLPYSGTAQVEGNTVKFTFGWPDKLETEGDQN